MCYPSHFIAFKEACLGVANIKFWANVNQAGARKDPRVSIPSQKRICSAPNRGLNPIDVSCRKRRLSVDDRALLRQSNSKRCRYNAAGSVFGLRAAAPEVLVHRDKGDRAR